MEVLVSELGVLLKMLDQENLSSSTQEKKTSVWNLLQQIQPSVSGTDYIYMNSAVYRNGTSFVESLFETFDCELGDLKDVTDDLKEDKNTQDDTLKLANSPASHSADSPPPLPTTPPPEEYYEEAVPLSPGKLPEYIITRDNDSDALSSSYESYEEDEEERSPGVRLTHQWPSDESSMPPARDCRILCLPPAQETLWPVGQAAHCHTGEQTTVHSTTSVSSFLQCYKSSKDTCPYVDLLLPQCTVVYAPKDSKRKHHELRFTLPNGDALVLAVQSKEQAHRWLRRLSAERNTSDSDSVGVSTAENGRENGKVKRGAFAAGRKITRIISFSKKKPPRPGDPRTSYSDPRQGYLSLLVNQVWREQWCCVCRGSLHFYHDKGDPRTSMPSLPLHGCEVVPGLGPKHPFAFRILRNSTELAALEASSSEELGRWLGVLLAETGSATDPESLHYDYVDVETIANIRDAARHSFLWATSSSSASTDSRTYDEVPNEDMQSGENRRQQSGNQGKRRSSFSSSDSDRTKPLVSLKRTGSKRRKSSLNKRVSQLEEACRSKEEERVDLELRLTQVQENLKKSLAGGALGAPVEAKPPVKGSTKKTQNIYSESLPVNCALEMRRRPPSVYASATGTVMQKAKVTQTVSSILRVTF
ncbi:Actin filament-associated protein 1-like 1 [Nibea albiflora]|uniref:Actin filament-associated protein 1-like 1 n=1 Tax=Nibea albiflora TaxID=240163 RepID=A0ACB7EPX1_NIBAL|nr:Actin filament-associated protein 1-like 1 [Nibea albiflora]